LQLLIFILICYGLTSILTRGKIFDRVRPSYYFFHCAQCMGAWVGFVVYASYYFHPELTFLGIHYTSVFYAGFISSGTSYILCQIIDDDGIKIDHYNNN